MSVETSEFPAFMRRLLRAWSRRVGEADTYDLAELVAFRDELDAAIEDAIYAGREGLSPWSWTDIADAVGISRQAARQRWRRPERDRHGATREQPV